MSSSSRPQSPVSDDTSAGVLVHNWWHNVPSKKSWTSAGARKKLAHAALHGPRCLLTGATGPSSALERCHLVARSISDTKRRNLQYAWGRKFDVDSRWNLFYLMAHMHRAFDARLGTDGKLAPGWVLVPEPNLVKDICAKVMSERDRRKTHGIKDPWPDFRSENWFPTRKGGYRYMFVPLSLKDENAVIVREDSDSSPIAIRVYYPPLYEDFPRLDSHIHPYMVIFNAYPKLRDNISTLPADLIDVMGPLEYIYDTWENAWRDTETPPFRVPATASDGSSQTGTRPHGASLGQSSLQNELHMVTGERVAKDDAAPSESISGRQNACGLDTLPAPFSGGTSDDPVPCQDAGVIVPVPTHSLAHIQEMLVADDDQYQRTASDFTKWILGVEAARERNQLTATSSDPTELGPYTMEQARAPPTNDWHHWTSEYAPWYVLLPRDRGLLSSNDWVEVNNYPPLTRAA